MGETDGLTWYKADSSKESLSGLVVIPPTPMIMGRTQIVRRDCKPFAPLCFSCSASSTGSRIYTSQPNNVFYIKVKVKGPLTVRSSRG